MADWLAEVDPRFRQYTYSLLQAGVDRNIIQSLTEQHLQHDCHIDNGVHRAKILSAIRKPIKPSQTDAKPVGPDVFISYRRTTGSQLARSVLRRRKTPDRFLNGSSTTCMLALTPNYLNIYLCFLHFSPKDVANILLGQCILEQ